MFDKFYIFNCGTEVVNHFINKFDYMRIHFKRRSLVEIIPILISCKNNIMIIYPIDLNIKINIEELTLHVPILPNFV